MLNTSQSNLSNSQRFITRPQRSPIIVRDTSVVSNYQAYREIYGNLPFQANNEATTTSRTMTRRNKKNYIFSSNNFHTNYNPFVDSQKVFAKDNRAKNHFENLKKGYRDLAIQVRKGTNAVDNREITIPSNTKNFIPTPKHPFIVSIPEFVRGGGKKIKTASVEIYLTEEDYKIRKRATLADIQKNPYLAGAYLAIKSMSAHMHRGVPYWDNPGEYVAYGYGPGLVKTVETAGTAPGLTLYTKFTAPGKRDSDRNQLNVFQEIFHKVFSYKNYNLLVNRSKRETDVRSLVIEAFMSKIGDQIHDGTITSEAGWNAAMRTVEKNDPNFIKNIKQLMLNAGDERANQINGESDFDRMELDSLPENDYFLINNIIKNNTNLNDAQILDLSVQNLDNILRNLTKENPTSAKIINTVLLQNNIQIESGKNLENISNTTFYQKIKNYAHSRSNLIATIGGISLLLASITGLVALNNKKNSKSRSNNRLPEVELELKELKDNLESVLIDHNPLSNISNVSENIILESTQLINETISSKASALDKYKNEIRLGQVASKFESEYKQKSNHLLELAKQYPACSQTIGQIQIEFSQHKNNLLPQLDNRSTNEYFNIMGKSSDFLDLKFGLVCDLLNKNHNELIAESNGRTKFSTDNNIYASVTEYVNAELNALNKCKTIEDIEKCKEIGEYLEQYFAFQFGQSTEQPAPLGELSHSEVDKIYNNCNSIEILYVALLNSVLQAGSKARDFFKRTNNSGDITQSF